MKTNIQKSLAAVLAAMAASTFAAEGVYELEPVDRDPGGWRISVGVRTAPDVKTKAGIDGAAAVSAAGRVKPASVGGASAKGRTSESTSVSEKTTDGGTTSSGTTKAEAEAASGYQEGVKRYEFDNGFIDEDVTGPSGKTSNWHFDDESAFDGAGFTISGAKDYGSTTVSKSATERTTTTTKTETKASGGAARVSFREDFGPDPASSSKDDATGLDILIGRIVWEGADFGVEANVGWTIYDDVDCFKAGGRVYTGRASASRGSVETTTTTTKKTDTTETTTTKTESGSFATVLQEPELTDLDDIRNPDGSIGGASYDGQPVQPGWTTAFLTVTPDRFSVVDRPGESKTSTETTTTEGTPTTAASTSRSPAASVSRTRTVDVYSRGELSLQELRLGATPYWKATDWLHVRANVGLLGSYAEVETRTTIHADGVPFSSSTHTDDDWKVQGYAGLSLAVIPVDWLEIAAGAEARFPSRKIRFDDGIVSGSTELAKWDAFVAVGIRF